MTKEEAIMNLQHTVDRMNKEKGNVIKELDRNGRTVDILCSKEALEMGIEALKEQKKGRWIPISERMPRTGETVHRSTDGAQDAKDLTRADGHTSGSIAHGAEAR